MQEFVPQGFIFLAQDLGRSFVLFLPSCPLPTLGGGGGFPGLLLFVLALGRRVLLVQKILEGIVISCASLVDALRASEGRGVCGVCQC